MMADSTVEDSTMEDAREGDVWPRRFALFRLWCWLQGPLLLAFVFALIGGFQHWLNQPLADVEIVGTLRQTATADVVRQVRVLAVENYADLDLAVIKTALEAHPWVHDVEVRRTWPVSLQVTVREERPIARWGQGGLLNEAGNVFWPHQIEGSESLPLLVGPQTRALEMMTQYLTISQLLRPYGLRLSKLELEPRGAWALQLDNGIRVLIGRGRIVEKVERFTGVYSNKLTPYIERIKQIDVRYTNGLTVTWHESREDAGGTGRGTK